VSEPLSETKKPLMFSYDPRREGNELVRRPHMYKNNIASLPPRYPRQPYYEHYSPQTPVGHKFRLLPTKCLPWLGVSTFLLIWHDLT